MTAPYGGGYGGVGTPYNQAGGYSQPYVEQPYGQASGGYGSNAGNLMSNEQRSQRLNQVAQQYNIHPQFAARLHALGNYEVVVLCDDSGSMNTPLQGTNQTRWDELKSVCFLYMTFFFFIMINSSLLILLLILLLLLIQMVLMFIF